MRKLQAALLVGLVACGDGDGRPSDAAVPDARSVVDAAVPDALLPGLCDSRFLPMNRANPLACCLKGDDEWFVSGNTPTMLVHRQHGKGCTFADGTSGCLGNQCAFGPCGTRIIETFPAPAYVFYPTSDPTVCGRQASTLPGVPEAYAATDTSYPPATTSCPYTDCTASGAVVKLTVNATATVATGSVKSAPVGIDLAVTGTATVSAVYGDTHVTLTATPTGAHARATFSGDCVLTGDFGAAAMCALVLGPNKVVNVVFDCDVGFTCVP